jgi:hypothetical protein
VAVNADVFVRARHRGKVTSLKGGVSRIKLQVNLFRKLVQIPDQQSGAVEGEQFFVAKIVQRRGDCLTAGRGEIGNFLVGDGPSIRRCPV